MITESNTFPGQSYHDLSAELLQEYRYAYRSLTYSFIPNSEAKTLFDDERIFKEIDCVSSRDQYLTWLLSDFIPFANKLNLPWLIFNGDRVSVQKISLSNEEKKSISNRGLIFFLYEAIYFRNLTSSVVEQRSPEESLREIQDIENFRAQNFPTSTFTVCVCELGLSRWLRDTKRFPKLKFIDFSALLFHEIRRSGTFPTSELPAAAFHKFAISLNFRYDPLREMLVAFLRSHSYFKNCYVSFFHQHHELEFRKRLPMDPTKLKSWPAISSGLALLQPEIPLVLDVRNPIAVDALSAVIPDLNRQNNQKDHNLIREKFYSESFLFAYVESRPYGPKSEISEKTLSPILAMRPFLPFAAQHFLKEMRKIGLQTFADFWDESYDDIDDLGERFDCYLSTLNEILSRPESELRKMAEKMYPILAHNRKFILQNFLPLRFQCLKEELKEVNVNI
jgi:hypothetical protein